MADEPIRPPVPDAVWLLSDDVRGRFTLIGALLRGLEPLLPVEHRSYLRAVVRVLEQEITGAARAAFAQGVEYGHLEEACEQARRRQEESLDAWLASFVEDRVSLTH